MSRPAAGATVGGRGARGGMTGTSSAAAASKMEHREIQTEATYHPHMPMEVPRRLTEMGSRQFDDLKQLRDHLKIAMTELGCTTYDVIAYKDVVLSMANSLPEMPLTDLLMLSSKLYRRVGSVGKLLGAFFNIVFAEDFADEDFHFVELRILRREVAHLQQRLQEVSAEKKALQDLYDELGKGSLDHAKVIEVLETRNDVLELRSSALEDQMALLFQQVSSDFRQQNVSLLQQATEDIDIQEQLSATRTAFVQSVDTVQNRLKFFQNLILELQEDPILQQDSVFKNKVKSLDVHVQHIVNRFTAVKEGLLGTANELIQALNEKRKALNFSVQHLKLYDTQTQKLRQARATLHELRHRVTEVERTLQHTFPHGGATRVDRNGDVAPLVGGLGGAVASSSADTPLLAPSPLGMASGVTTRSGSVAGTGALANDIAESLRQSKYAAPNVRQVIEQVQLLNDVVIRLTAHLDTEDEQKALLRTISLTAPTSGRSDANREKLLQATQQLQQGSRLFTATAQQPLALLSNSIANGAAFPQISGGPPGSPAGGAIGGSGRLARSGSLVGSARSTAAGGALAAALSSGDFSSTLASTISIGENGTVEMDPVALSALREDFVTKLNFLRDVYEERISDLEARSERVTRKLQTTQTELARVLKEEAQKVEESDREAILRAKEAWVASREVLATEAQPTRSTALQAVQEVLRGQINIAEFMDSRPASAKSSAAESSAPSSGMQAFISPQARIQMQRQNVERRQERDTVSVPTPSPSSSMRGPIMRTEAAVAKQERNEQLIRAIRRYTGVAEFHPPPPVLGGSNPPPVSRRLSVALNAITSKANANQDDPTGTDDP